VEELPGVLLGLVVADVVVLVEEVEFVELDCEFAAEVPVLTVPGIVAVPVPVSVL
jgi:hypothetical protein